MTDRERIQLEPLAPKERLDRALARYFPEESRATLQRWIEEGRVDVAGSRARASAKVGPGTVIDVEPGPPPISSAEPDPTVAFPVVFEDEHLIVVDKPAGLVVHPGRGHWTGTLVNGLLSRPGFQRPPSDPRDPEGALRPGIVHRIDKDTSGLLVVAKNEATREGLKQQLAEHTVERCYRAITVGVPTEGRLETLHGRDPRNRLRFTSRVSEGKTAVTNIAVQQRFGRVAAEIVCRLETGRTHQIRVHLAVDRATPLLGDDLYGAQWSLSLADARPLLQRHALHAELLGFRHPITGEAHRFESPLPPDLAAVLSWLRAQWPTDA